jgi:hypothetical protein
MRRAALGLVAFGMLVLVPGAFAGVLPGWAESIRWAGWIASRHGQHFDRVSASWRVPTASCPPRGKASYSLTWIGLGGANENKLEQIGTETDCAPWYGSGEGFVPSTPYSLMWWEVLPAPEQYAGSEVDPGDLVDASVTVSGGRATVFLRDVTRDWRYTKRVRVKPRALTESSADWIEEDPEICPGAVIQVNCPEKPLAHYRTVTFSKAVAGTGGHVRGPILDSHWDAIRYGMLQGNAHLRLLSWPSRLNAAGDGFSVSRTDTLHLPPEPV